MIGTIAPLRFWICAAGEPWSERERRNAEIACTDAYSWLEGQALRYGVSLRFGAGREFGAPRAIQLERSQGELDADLQSIEWMQVVASQLGFRDPGQIIDEIEQEQGPDGMHALLLIKRSGRSYAVSIPGDPEARHALAAAACYVADEETLAATIAHEVLHLHGAWDLYEDNPTPEGPHEYAKLLFPNDVMHRVAPRLTELEVSDLTAWRIGWCCKAEPWFDWFARSSDRHGEPDWSPAPKPPKSRSGARPPQTIEHPQPTRNSGKVRAQAPASRVDTTDLLATEEKNYSSLLAQVQSLIRTSGVTSRAALLQEKLEPPRHPQPRILTNDAEWRAYSQAQLDRAGLALAVKALGGAGSSPEQRIQAAFNHWKKRIGELRDIAVQGNGASSAQLSDAVRACRAANCDTSTIYDWLQRRDVADLVRAHLRFEKSLSTYRRTRHR